jgi:hypothetical protein
MINLYNFKISSKGFIVSNKNTFFEHLSSLSIQHFGSINNLNSFLFPDFKESFLTGSSACLAGSVCFHKSGNLDIFI